MSELGSAWVRLMPIGIDLAEELDASIDKFIDGIMPTPAVDCYVIILSALMTVLSKVTFNHSEQQIRRLSYRIVDVMLERARLYQLKNGTGKFDNSGVQR